MKSRKATTILLPVIVLIIAAIAIYSNRSNQSVYQHDSGFIFGTSYNITYQSDANLKEEIVATLNKVDASLSPFNDKSIITAVNNNKDIELDSLFIEVFNLATKVNKETAGAFDITVAPLVNAWGFGFKSGKMPEGNELDSLRSIIGFEKVSLANGRIKKTDPRVMLDCSAIAKGYGVDCVARLLREKGIKNFMIEIGGEMVVQGINAKGTPWNIGVTKPTDDSLSTNTELQTILSISDIAIATSGNYRNFYYKDGKKYAHTIDPATGHPVQHSILSATVLASNCAEADAYATSFMVMGLEKAKAILQKHPELKAYFIYNDAKGNYAVWYSPGLSPG